MYELHRVDLAGNAWAVAQSRSLTTIAALLAAARRQHPTFEHYVTNGESEQLTAEEFELCA